MSKKTEIGYFNENFEKEFLGIKGKQQVYHLHNNYVDFSKSLYSSFEKSIIGC